MKTVRKERKLLKNLIRLAQSYDNNAVPITKLPISANNYYLNQLISKGLVKINNSTGIDPITHRPVNKGPVEVTVTDQGQHFFENLWEDIKAFLLKSVLVPIVVSIITTILVLLIKGMFR